MDLKVSYNWIKEYVKIDLPIKDFVKEFSLKSQTIDRFKETGKGLEKVVVGKILTIEKHPNADKLHVAKVDIGRKSSLQLIFGQVAKLKVGDQLPVAVAPVKLPTGLLIKKAKIRGVTSEGMLCLNSELGLSEYDEVIFFDEKVLPGTSIVEALKLDDYILDIEVTSNRPDAMSVVGLAREGVAVLGTKLKWRMPNPNLTVEKEISLTVENKEPKLCTRYQAVVMTDVKVGPSPLWMRMRLISAGLRPINNLVDITNYILLEYGQPMHVFDYEKLNGRKVVIRNAKPGEKILALDGNDYKLKADNLVIADSKVPAAIAGVMGGEKSAATDKTKTIVFEAANFDPVQVRKTARALNLHSDSSDLFEKGLAQEATLVAVLRAIELTKKLAGGKVASSIIDIRFQDYKPVKIKFNTGSIKRHLGIEIPIEDVKKILESLGFQVSGAKTLNVVVPYWRVNDVTHDYDLIEEIARIYGYHNLPTELPIGEIPVSEIDPIFFWEKTAKNFLAGLGFTEVFNCSMLSADLLKKVKFPVKEAIKIDNPLNEETRYLRTTLLPQVLQNVKDNLNNFSEQKIFELSNVYIKQAEASKSEQKLLEAGLPEEMLKLTGAVVAEANTFLQAKGVVELLLRKMGVTDYNLVLTDPKCPLWDKDKTMDVYKGKLFLGQFGIIRKNILENFNINQPIVLFDFDFNALMKIATTTKVLNPIPEFPSVTRDLAIIVDVKLSWEEVNQMVSKADDLIVEVDYLSTFIDPSLGAGKKSLAFRIVFRSKKRTLKSEEVDQIVKKIVAGLEKKFEAKLR